MHHKVFIIDGKIMATGSFNFSSNANETNDENMDFFNNSDLADRYEKEFEAVLAQAAPPDDENCESY